MSTQGTAAGVALRHGWTLTDGMPGIVVTYTRGQCRVYAEYDVRGGLLWLAIERRETWPYTVQSYYASYERHDPDKKAALLAELRRPRMIKATHR